MRSLKFLVFSFSLLVFSSCSPKIKIILWAKHNQQAALALGIWSAANAKDATALLDVDCNNRKQFKQKISDALTNAPAKPESEQNYYINQAIKLFGDKVTKNHKESEGFADWCRQYPSAAKKLRSHSKAL